MVDDNFSRAAPITPMVVLSMIIFGAHRHFDFGILYSKKTKFLAYINIFCAVLHLLGNFLLIQIFGLYGAVFSSIIALTVQAGMLYKISQKFYPIPYQFKRLLTCMMVAIIVFVLSRLWQTNIIWLNFIIKIILLFSFPFSIYYLKILDKEDRKRIKEYIVGRLFSNKPKDFIVKQSERL
jgi:O-antigen/teichoic acid export membrane protein